MSVLSLRYITCIQVDEESLESVLDGTGFNYLDPAWVNLIRCDDNYDVGVQPPFRHPKTNKWVVDERWMIIPAYGIKSSYYYDTVRNLDDFWRVYYATPPEVV